VVGFFSFAHYTDPMTLTSENQARFDSLAKEIGDELVVQVLAIGRPMKTEDDIRRVAILVADEVWGAIDPVPRTGPPPM
jgi:hypothetical protein